MVCRGTTCPCHTLTDSAPPAAFGGYRGGPGKVGELPNRRSDLGVFGAVHRLPICCRVALRSVTMTQQRDRRRHGQGSLRQRRDRWVSQGRHPVTGRLVSHTHPVGITPAAAERLHGDWIAALRRQRADAAGLTVSGLCDLWLDAQPGIADSTRRSYAVILRRVTSRIGDTAVADLDPWTIDRLTVDLWRAHSPKTASTTRNLFATVCRRAVAWRALERSPFADARPAPRTVHRPPAAPSTADVRAIIAAEPSPRWRACWELLAHTGCRPGEILAARWDDIDTARATLTVARTLTTDAAGRWQVGTTTKTGRVRTLALGVDAVATLDRWRADAPAGDWLFTSPLDGARPIHKQSLDQAWRRAVRRAGVAPIPPKGLRHWHASTLVQAGVPISTVSERLGHSSMALVHQLYGRHVETGAQQAAVALLPDLAV